MSWTRKVKVIAAGGAGSWLSGIKPTDAARVRAASAVLWLLILLAAVGGVAAWFRPVAVPAPGTELRPVAQDRAWEAGGFGARFVAAYLMAEQATAGDLAVFLGYSPDLPATQVPDRSPGRVDVVGVEPAGKYYFAVTVVAGEPGREAFWRVGVVSDGEGRLVASGLPSPVPGPAPGEPVALDVVPSQVPSNTDPAVQTVAGWVAAYACGEGELSRYLAPDVSLRPVSPPLCGEARLDRWGSRAMGDDRLVVVTEVVLDGEGGTRRVTFSLALSRRDGRWEIAEVLPALPLVGATAAEGEGSA